MPIASRKKLSSLKRAVCAAAMCASALLISAQAGATERTLRARYADFNSDSEAYQDTERFRLTAQLKL